MSRAAGKERKGEEDLRGWWRPDQMTLKQNNDLAFASLPNRQPVKRVKRRSDVVFVWKVPHWKDSVWKILHILILTYAVLPNQQDCGWNVISNWFIKPSQPYEEEPCWLYQTGRNGVNMPVVHQNCVQIAWPLKFTCKLTGRGGRVLKNLKKTCSLLSFLQASSNGLKLQQQRSTKGGGPCEGVYFTQKSEGMVSEQLRDLKRGDCYVLWKVGLLSSGVVVHFSSWQTDQLRGKHVINKHDSWCFLPLQCAFVLT